MTRNSQKQTGSALIVVVIIAVIVVIGALGFIFWQNHMDKTANTPVAPNTTDSTTVDPYKDWATYESPTGKYKIKYPKDWLALKETVQDGPYIRNFDPTSKQPQGGYPDGYINLRVLVDENNENFKAMTGHTTTDWYDLLGKVEVHSGPITHLPEDVKGMIISGLPAKSAKAVFTETDEVIYVLRGDKLYSINLYPYGISTDPTVKLMLDSFTFTY